VRARTSGFAGALTVCAIVACDEGGRRTSVVASPAMGDTVMIDGRVPSCTGCSLDTAFVATIGTRTDPEVPQRLPAVLRDSRGVHYLVFDGWIDKPILRYDSAGQYLGIVGRYGQGPGEYQMTFSVFVGPGDSLFVWAEGRLQVFDTDARYARVAHPPHGIPFAVGDPDTRVVYSRLRSREREPSAWRASVVVSDSDRVVSDSFATFSAGGFAEARAIRGPRGEIWTYLSVNGNYRLERHARDGRVKQLVGVTVTPDGRRPLMTSADFDSVRAAALARAGPPPRRPVNSRPRPGPRARTEMVVDSAGLLWVARAIAAPSWDTITIGGRFDAPNEAPGEFTIDRDDEDRIHHTVIEVIDPDRAALIARTQLPFLATLARPGFVARITADEDGMFRTMVYRVTLRRGG
jgi:hypothetical protein